VEKGSISTAIGYGLVGPETWGKPVRAIHGLDDLEGLNRLLSIQDVSIHPVSKGNLVTIPEPDSRTDGVWRLG